MWRLGISFENSQEIWPKSWQSNWVSSYRLFKCKRPVPWLNGYCPMHWENLQTLRFFITWRVSKSGFWWGFLLLDDVDLVLIVSVSCSYFWNLHEIWEVVSLFISNLAIIVHHGRFESFQDCLLILLLDGGTCTAKIKLSNYEPFELSWKRLTLWEIVGFFKLGSTMLTIPLWHGQVSYPWMDAVQTVRVRISYCNMIM